MTPTVLAGALILTLSHLFGLGEHSKVAASPLPPALLTEANVSAGAIYPRESIDPIVALEYFIDTDPGEGSAKSINIGEGPRGEISLDFEPDLSGLDFGGHTLYLRALNERGNWSIVSIHSFYLTPFSANTSPKLVEAEWFEGSDPGYGEAISIDFNPAWTIETSISVNDFGEGANDFYVRFKDALGSWSLPVHHGFYEFPIMIPEAIVWRVGEDGATVAEGSEPISPSDPDFSVLFATGAFAVGSSDASFEVQVGVRFEGGFETYTGASGFSLSVFPPTIISQPVELSVSEGSSASFSVAATGSGDLSYVWEYSEDGGNTWESVLGATASVYEINNATAAMDGRLYRVHVSNGGGEVASSSVRLNVLVGGDLPSWAASAVDLGNNWFWSNWLGSFNLSQPPWILHPQHRWLFPFPGSTADHFYFWDAEMGTVLYTGQNLYPVMFRFSDDTWVFYELGSREPRWFVDLMTGVWESW